MRASRPRCVPTYEAVDRFLRDWADLTPEQREAFHRMRRKFVTDLKSGGPLRAGLRVRQLESAPGVFEITWAPDGRALYEYGTPKSPGDVHIIWRRIGTHAIFDNP